MSWVAAIGAGASLGAAAIKSNAAQGAGGSGFMGGMGGQSQTDASSATYGTTMGNDGWSINFGSGSQVATPTKTTSDTYSDAGMSQSQPNPLTGMRQQLPDLSGYAAGGIDTPVLLLLAAGGFLLLRK